MKAEWTPSGGSKVTLGDDAAKQTIVLEQFGGQAAEQVSQIFGAAVVVRIPRGNVAGDLVFTASKSHASRDAAATYAIGEYARMAAQGSLVLTMDSTTMTFANAVLRGVQAMPGGTRWGIRYTFGITTVS